MTTETNAERIQLIKETIGEMKERERKHNPLFYRDPAIMALYNDMEFLIQQSERVQELEKVIELSEAEKGLKSTLNDHAVRIIEEKDKENDCLRKALKFYANEENYKDNVIDQWEPVCPITQDGGEGARRALKGVD